jgi:hypothetical protein
MELRWGTDILRLDLHSVDEGARLTLTDTLNELGKASRDAAGWHERLQALWIHLGGEQGTAASWRSLFDAYAERFGPQASTIGPPEGMLEAKTGE